MSPGCRDGFIYILIKSYPGVMSELMKAVGAASCTDRSGAGSFAPPLCPAALHHADGAHLLTPLLPLSCQTPGPCPPCSAHTWCFGLWGAVRSIPPAPTPGRSRGRADCWAGGGAGTWQLSGSWSHAWDPGPSEGACGGVGSGVRRGAELGGTGMPGE